MAKSKMTLKNETVTINCSTGETLTIQKTFNIKVTEYDQFHSVFYDFLPELYQLQHVHRKVFDELAAHSNFNTGLVALIPSVKAKICDRTKISDSQLRTALVALKKKNLIAGSRSEYYINPKYLWKGTSDSRMNVLKNQWRMVVEFEIDPQSALKSETFQSTPELIEGLEIDDNWSTVVVSAKDLNEDDEWLKNCIKD